MTEEQVDQLIKYIEISIKNHEFPSHNMFLKLSKQEKELRKALIDKK